MTKRGLAWTGVVALLVLAAIGLWTIYGINSISLTEAQIQERLNKQLDREFPVKGMGGLLVRAVAIKSADVRIQDGQVYVLVNVEGALRMGKKFDLTAYAVGVPDYAHGEFFFRPEKIEVQKFAYEGSTPTELFTRFGRKYISGEKTRQLIEDKAPKVEEWMTTVAQNAATRALERRPVYKPKDDVKGLLLKASLESVKVEQDKLVITFSLWQLTLSVLLGLLLLVTAGITAIAMLRHPYWGLALIALS